MRKCTKIKSQYLYKAVYDLCFQANTCLNSEVYTDLKLIEKSNLDSREKMYKIFTNNSIANLNKRPLCQDTGQIVTFFEIGENVFLDQSNPTEIINKAISDCYNENYFRKSIVKNALFDRTNTNNNIPSIVYIDYIKGDDIKINILIKGGGAENMSDVKMFSPSATEQEIFDYVLNVVSNAGENACPPLFLGIGVGGTMDYACVLSKKAFFAKDNTEFTQRLKNYINEKTKTKVANIQMLCSSTHIASLPVAVTVNCHSARHAGAIVNEQGYKITTKFISETLNDKITLNEKEILVTDINKLKKTKQGENILLSGTIYTARDAAHKKLVEMINKKEKLPFDLKNSIIFYAGPCPKNNNEIIGPVGPTTSKRMDKFAPILYENGVLATIGKGERSTEVKQSLKNNSALYFSIQGGIASLLQNCIKSAEIIAFEELGAEAIYKLQVEKLPIKLELK